MNCTHKSLNLNNLSLKELNSIRCPMGHNTWCYTGNICYCYNKECWDYPFCGFCQCHRTRQRNKPTGFWLFALSFNKRLKGKELAEYATPLWEKMNNEKNILERKS